ncbi:MarR family winged helix-turn-helix transcriptional regulator [Microbacterium sp. ZXX196]|uniref:MarR family winged helix-turn-helix transcriptional regulator n=1 Tax=Microbacterium sp. ZXX196 TaxID=2609291 RepID=UPI0012B77E7C|nr:MarR family transcriptional regulator [Microbacterium sp. ZXX196]MTE24303.1 MarR family transcriptional regulator [Microbacterium sp. ZXX196]
MTNDDPLSREASDLRAATLRLARRIRQQRSVSTMSDGQFAVLVALHLHGPHTLTALAERDGITAPSMNRTVNGLEELGYVARSADAGDRRKVQIAITEAGTGVVEDTVRRRDTWLARILVDLPQGERDTLHRAAEIILREVHR